MDEHVLEIEAPPATGGQELLYHGVLDRRVLPLRLQRCWCCCCCWCAKHLPRSWVLIRDWTHFYLVFGTPLCMCLTVWNTYALLHNVQSSSCWRVGFCLPGALVITYTLICVAYFMQIIGRYDKHPINREQEIRAQRDLSLTSYSFIIQGMHDLLDQSLSAESSAGLAERSFEARCRDFQRFLQKVKSLCRNQDLEDPSEAELLLEQFKIFVVNWLRILSECSFEPVKSPMTVVTELVLDKQASIAHVVDLVVEKLQTADMKFVTHMREEHQRTIERSRCAATRHMIAVETNAAWTLQQALLKQGARQARRFCPTWLSCGYRGAPRCLAPLGHEGFPKEICVPGLRIVLLSIEHSLLLVAFVLGWSLMIFNRLVWSLPHPMCVVYQCTVLTVELCLLFVLAVIEELTKIQQLEQEVRNLGIAGEEAQRQSASMQKFWTEVQMLSELWLHRTVPCLDLYHELQGHLEDSARGDMVIFMVEINRLFANLDQYLFNIEHWCSSALPYEEKKRLGNFISALCGERDFGVLLTNLNLMITEGPSYSGRA